MMKLNGSEKQVKWANDIRENMVNRIEKIQYEDLKIAATKAVESQESAAWFIDHKDNFLMTVVKENAHMDSQESAFAKRDELRAVYKSITVESVEDYEEKSILKEWLLALTWPR